MTGRRRAGPARRRPPAHRRRKGDPADRPPSSPPSASARTSRSGTRPARSRLALAREAGKLGLLGMHLTGYGCAGTNAVSYGLACMELEAARLRRAQPGLGAGLAGDVRDLEVRLRGAEAAAGCPAWPPAS